MPKQTRWVIKRKFDGYIFNADRLKDELVGMANLYIENQAPEYAPTLFKLAEGADQLSKALAAFREIV